MRERSHTTHAGHVVTVRPHEENPDALVFLHDGEELAELHPPSHESSTSPDRLDEWRLTFTDWPEMMVVAQPGDVPIPAALFYLDVRLDDERNGHR